MDVERSRAIAKEEVISAALGFLDFLEAYPTDCAVKPLPSRLRADVFPVVLYLDRPTWQWYVYVTGFHRKQGRRATFRALVEYASGTVTINSYREV